MDEINKNPEDKKKISKVIQGSAKTKKKSELSKMATSFVASDISNVKSYLLYEVLIPSAKKTITDMVSNGIAMLLGTDPVRRDKDKIRGGSVKVSYRDYYETQRERGSVKSFGRSIDYDEIIFDTRIDAESVLVRMEEIIDKYEFVSISDLYEMADLSAPPYTATKYGWVSLVNAEVVRVYDGYKIKLPRPVPRD